MSLNILEFTKEIINIQKLHDDLRELELSGEHFDFINVKGAEIKLHYTQNLNQSQIDEVSALVNSFVEVSVIEELNYLLRKQQDDGFEVYTKVISRINSDGTLYTGLDQGLTVYPNFLMIRNLLKDGFFDFALRYVVKTIAPSGMLTEGQITYGKQLIREVAKKYGATDAYLDQVENEETI